MLHLCMFDICFLGILGNLIEKSLMMGTKVYRYTPTINEHTIVLTTLKPIEVYADQVRIARECKLREKKLSIPEKERKDNMSEISKRKKNIELSVVKRKIRK